MSGPTASGHGPRPIDRARRAPPRRRARGSALLIAIILIFMLSTLGVSVMRGSTLEHRMAANAVQANEVVQAAESATEFGLNRNDNLGAAFVAANAAEPTERTLVIEVPAPKGAEGDGARGPIAGEVQIRYVGAGLAPGYSVGTFSALRYIAQGRASVEATGASSVIEQGAYRAVPGS